MWCEMDLQKFSELENRLKILVSDYGSQKKRIQELEELLQNKVSELEEVKGKIEGLRAEREAVRAKVDSLLELLQDIAISS